MERNAATDVEETRHLRVFAFHGKIAVTGDEDDPVDGVLKNAVCRTKLESTGIWDASPVREEDL